MNYKYWNTFLLNSKNVCFLQPFRQPTPFDKLCYRVVDKAAGPLGSRVFCDIDTLIREILGYLLDEDQISEWEAGKEQREENYDKLRRK